MDLYYAYSKEKGFADIEIVGGDFLLCDQRRYDPSTDSFILKSSLQVAIELALFTDRRANTEEIRKFQGGRIERLSRRGFWPNTYNDIVQGSGLWLLSRGKKSNETLADAEKYARECTQHLIDEGIVATITPTASFRGEALVLLIQYAKPDGQEFGFTYQFTWDGIEAL